jgi:hypothetical protein
MLLRSPLLHEDQRVCEANVSCSLLVLVLRLLRAIFNSTTVDLTSEYSARRRCIDIACLDSRSFCNMMIPSTPLTHISPQDCCIAAISWGRPWTFRKTVTSLLNING